MTKSDMMLEALEDEILTLLEQGAMIPAELTIYLDWEALVVAPSVLQVAGHTVKFRAPDLIGVSEDSVIH